MSNSVLKYTCTLPTSSNDDQKLADSNYFLAYCGLVNHWMAILFLSPSERALSHTSTYAIYIDLDHLLTGHQCRFVLRTTCRKHSDHHERRASHWRSELLGEGMLELLMLCIPYLLLALLSSSMYVLIVNFVVGFYGFGLFGHFYIITQLSPLTRLSTLFRMVSQSLRRSANSTTSSTLKTPRYLSASAMMALISSISRSVFASKR